MSAFWQVIALAVLGGAAAQIILVRRRQRASLRELARRHGLSFSPEDLIDLHERYQSLELIRRGHNRQAHDLLYGTLEEGLVSIFHYSYELGCGARKTTCTWWMVVLETECVRDAWVVGHGANAETVGLTLKLDAREIFAERSASRELLSAAQIRETLLASPASWQWEVRGRFLAIAAPGTSGPGELENLLAGVKSLAGTLLSLERTN
ncbi:MAG: hypothetical protein AMXMBFR13_45640 [Phycisphaerae bacterium]